MIDYVSAIHQRISRRSYLPAPIEEEKLAVLKEEIEKANRESGLTITLLEDGSEAFDGVKSYGMFSGVRSLIVLKGFEETEHLREKAGYYGERLVLAATALALAPAGWAAPLIRRAKSLRCKRGSRLSALSPSAMWRRAASRRR